jgi:hypothetical protein
MQVTINLNKRTALIAAAVATLLAVLVACSSATLTKGQAEKEQNFDAAARRVPYPSGVVSKNPTERMNVAEKLKRDSDPNRLSYVYLLSMDGKVIAHFQVKGKVSSSDSQLTSDQRVIDADASGNSFSPMLVEAGGDDATFGNREPGIFFFTTDGKMVTWSGDYLQFDRPMDVKTPVSLVAQAS